MGKKKKKDHNLWRVLAQTCVVELKLTILEILESGFGFRSRAAHPCVTNHS